MAPRGVILAAPSSGSGKTTVALGLLRRCRQLGLKVGACKAGPDYIDPQFHSRALGRPCRNLDIWAMRDSTRHRIIDAAVEAADWLLVEGVMGLFDGAAGGTGSTAALAAWSGWPVVLVVNAAAQAQSVGALVHGFRTWRSDVTVAGVILNRVGGAGHAALARAAVAETGCPVLGVVPRDPALAAPSRHLGLVPADEWPDLEPFLDHAAACVGAGVDPTDLDRLAAPLHAVSAPFVGPGVAPAPGMPPLGQRLAVAADVAFCFRYPHQVDTWHAAGAAVLPFSPLADQAPDATADAVFLPGGYPELYAGVLAGNHRFLDGLRAAAVRGVPIYGECGGYMVLGDGLEDAEGHCHAMAGLLPVQTSFARRRLHLGYRQSRLVADGPLGRAGSLWRGHEFHYATIAAEDTTQPVFQATGVAGGPETAMGSRRGATLGSFLHVIDRA